MSIILQNVQMRKQEPKEEDVKTKKKNSIDKRKRKTKFGSD